MRSSKIGGISGSLTNGFVYKLGTIKLIVGSQVKVHIKFRRFMVVSFHYLVESGYLHGAEIEPYDAEALIGYRGEKADSRIAAEALIRIILTANAVINERIAILYHYDAAMRIGFVGEVHHAQHVAGGIGAGTEHQLAALQQANSRICCTEVERIFIAGDNSTGSSL